MKKFFKLDEKNTSVKTEMLAGLTTFLAMAYILAVNPNILGVAGLDEHSVFMATAISAGIGSILMGVIANYPVALAPGMGVNAFFTFTAVQIMGQTPETALAAVFVSGVIFLLISVTGIRRILINAIPKELKLAISAGIGFFIAFVGMQSAGIIVPNPATAVTLGDVTSPPVLLALFGIAITIVLVIRKAPAAVFIGLVATAVIGVIFGSLGVEGMPMLPSSFNISFEMKTAGMFLDGFDGLFNNIGNSLIIIFSFLFVDFFDTAGTLVAVAGRTGLMNEDGELQDVEKALVADAVATVIGAGLGTSTVTSFVESSSGVEVGGRTGLTAVTTGVLFLLSLFIAPLLSVVTSAVTAPALIVVGVLMAQHLGDIKWDDFPTATSAFVTVIGMIVTYSISNGIALGFITYVIATVAAKRYKEISPVVWILCAIFVAYFAFLH